MVEEPEHEAFAVGVHQLEFAQRCGYLDGYDDLVGGLVESELSTAQVEWRVLPVTDHALVVAGAALPSDRHACFGPQHDHPARAAAVAGTALAWQRALPSGSDITCCCRPDDVAQVPGQPAGRAWRVAGQIEEVVQVGDQHSQDCTGSRWPTRLAA